MDLKGDCPVCGTSNCGTQRDSAFLGGLLTVDCPQCGRFSISDTARLEMANRGLHRGLVSGWIRRRLEEGDRVILDRKEIDHLSALPVPTFKECVEAYLIAASKRLPNLRNHFGYNDPELVAAAYCSSASELKTITEYLENEGLLKTKSVGSNLARMSAKGHMACDELRAQHAASSQGFIAMSFSKEMEQARRLGLEVGIRDAGYKPHRVDDAQHIDQIDDRIIADIRRSKFVVADLTGHRQGVYYEAGFARGLDKPVFYTCHVDHKNKIHFDVRQFNCIIWQEVGDLAAQLRDRIEAVLGMGPEHSEKS